jgi:hypothetical protein
MTSTTLLADWSWAITKLADGIVAISAIAMFDSLKRFLELTVSILLGFVLMLHHVLQGTKKRFNNLAI